MLQVQRGPLLQCVRFLPCDHQAATLTCLLDPCCLAGASTCNACEQGVATQDGAIK